MFKGKTVLERLNKRDFCMKSSLIFETPEVKVQVRKGFVTDGASIPKMFRSIIGCPFNGEYIGSAIIHDALYATHKLSKKESDRLFLTMLEDNGVSKIKRKLMFWAVKYRGKKAWNAKTVEQMEQQSAFVVVIKK